MSEKTTLYIPEWRDNPVLARCLGPGRGVLDWREDARRDEAVQRLLAEVHRREGYLECCCRTPRPRLYVARHGRFYRLCRYPATGGDHKEDCVFFERDGGGSRSETAPAGRREDTLRLKVGRRIEADRPSAGHTLPPRDGGGHGTSHPRQRLFGFFRDLWEGADLNIHRSDAGKTWPVVRAALARRADGVTWAGAPLAESLLSPIPPSPVAEKDHADHQIEKRTGFSKAEAEQAIRQAWDQSDRGQNFKTALEQDGLLLARGNRRDFVVVDMQAGTMIFACDPAKSPRQKDAVEGCEISSNNSIMAISPISDGDCGKHTIIK